MYITGKFQPSINCFFLISWSSKFSSTVVRFRVVDALVDVQVLCVKKYRGQNTDMAFFYTMYYYKSTDD